MQLKPQFPLRHVVAVLVMGSVLAINGIAVDARAQSASAGPVKRVHFITLSNSCSQMNTMPTSLARTPEGEAVMKMRQELAATAAAMANQRSRNPSTMEVRNLNEATRTIDSIWRVMNGSVQVMSAPDGRRIRVTIDSSPASRREIEAKIREVMPQVSNLSASVASPRMMIRAQAPSGWIGVTSSANFVRKIENGSMVMGYCEYPVVESVEPGSPSDKAGVLAGDTIVAYNGKDLLEQDIDYTQVLVPGQSLRMKVHRAGKVKEMSMTAVKRHDDVVFTVPRAAGACGGAPCEIPGGAFKSFPSDSFVFRILVDSTKGARGMPMPGAAGGYIVRKPQGMGGGAGAGPMPTAGIMIPSVGDMIAGARLMAIDADMASIMGVDSAGIVVTTVIPGSPAYDAGLKRGEFIREVNGVQVRDLPSLRRALVEQSDRIKLLVTSKSAPPRVVLLR